MDFSLLPTMFAQKAREAVERSQPATCDHVARLMVAYIGYLETGEAKTPEKAEALTRALAETQYMTGLINDKNKTVRRQSVLVPIRPVIS